MSYTSLSKSMSLLAIAATLAACGGGGDDPLDPGAGGGAGGVPPLGAGPGVAANTANVALRSLSYTDDGNWRYRVEMQTAADATFDTEGNQSRYEEYTTNTNGTRNTWSFGPDPVAKDDLFFNGSTWRKCEAGFRTTLSQLNSRGERSFNYCDQYALGNETVVPVDVSGQRIADVMTSIRGETGNDGFIEYSAYGPANPVVLGNTAFPADSYRQNVLSAVNVFRPRYAGTPDTRVRSWLPTIAAGGDARVDGTIACANIAGNAQPDQVSPFAVTLEQMIASAQGKPCIFATASTTNQPVSPNEFWQPTTQEFGVVQGVEFRPAGSGTYYLPLLSLRVAFTRVDEVTYYECLVRNSSPTSVRNCTALGTGSFSTQQAGDARVMAFDNLPARFLALPRDRVFVERGGFVFTGTIERVGAYDQVGFNDAASRAILNALRIPVPAPR